VRRCLLATGFAVVLAAATGVPLLAQAPRPAVPYVLVGPDGRHAVSAAAVGDQDMLRLDEIAAALQLSVREDRPANALTVSRGLNTAVLSLNQPLASMGGRVISLSAPPARDGSRWLVPLDAVGRALASIAGMRLDVRRASRLIVVGDLRVPRVVIQQEQNGAATRVNIDVSPRATFTIAQEPRRLLVRFDVDGLDAGPIAAGGGLVESVAASDPATIVIGLDKAFASYRASTVPMDASSSRVVIDLLPAGAAPPQPPTGLTPAQAQPTVTEPQGPARPAEAPAAIPAAAPPGIRTIVLDPGHGGDEQGTKGQGGLLEKDVTLDVGRRLRNAIEGRLGIRVLLTRDDDRLVPPDERASVANNNKADLFISLHANSSPNRGVKGAEVYYLSLEGFSAESRKLAESPDTTAVPILGGGSRNIDLILWDMAQARHLTESSAFAVTVEEELRRRVEMSPNPIQQAPFRVLVAANMPAVLVEMAFLSNPEQEVQLASDHFRTQVVQALYDAIVRYRARVEARSGARRP
jgi:N-acetylmuramoyl-L-alanine amidase